MANTYSPGKWQGGRVGKQALTVLASGRRNQGWQANTHSPGKWQGGRAGKQTLTVLASGKEAGLASRNLPSWQVAGRQGWQADTYRPGKWQGGRVGQQTGPALDCRLVLRVERAVVQVQLLAEVMKQEAFVLKHMAEPILIHVGHAAQQPDTPQGNKWTTQRNLTPPRAKSGPNITT